MPSKSKIWDRTIITQEYNQASCVNVIKNNVTIGPIDPKREYNGLWFYTWSQDDMDCNGSGCEIYVNNPVVTCRSDIFNDIDFQYLCSGTYNIWPIIKGSAWDNSNTYIDKYRKDKREENTLDSWKYKRLMETIEEDQDINLKRIEKDNPNWDDLSEQWYN